MNILKKAVQTFIHNIIFDVDVKFFLLPGGTEPERQSDGAAGYDVYIRAVVSDTEKDPNDGNLRKTLFDFKNIPKDPEVRSHVIDKNRKPIRDDNGNLVYRMKKGESVLVGIGFLTEMDLPMFYWITPRSGLSSKHGITVTNAPGTVDADYRGEAGVLVYNRDNEHFDLRHGLRIAQILFVWSLFPRLTRVSSPKELSETVRGKSGFGDSGLFENLLKIKKDRSS